MHVAAATISRTVLQGEVVAHDTIRLFYKRFLSEPARVLVDDTNKASSTANCGIFA
jgi:hypothetical protein